jgi:hypothetical protein
MAGKRKATELDAPGSAQPPPPQRWRGDRDDDDHSSLSDYGGGRFPSALIFFYLMSAGFLGFGVLRVRFSWFLADSQSDRATLGDADDERWSLSDGHVGSVGVCPIALFFFSMSACLSWISVC